MGDPTIKTGPGWRNEVAIPRRKAKLVQRFEIKINTSIDRIHQETKLVVQRDVNGKSIVEERSFGRIGNGGLGLQPHEKYTVMVENQPRVMITGTDDIEKNFAGETVGDRMTMTPNGRKVVINSPGKRTVIKLSEKEAKHPPIFATGGGPDKFGFRFSFLQTLGKLVGIKPKEPKDVILFTGDGNDVAKTGGGNDYIEGLNGRLIANARDGNDVIHMGTGMIDPEARKGSAGSWRNDIGSVADGGDGNDTFIVPLGTGQDKIIGGEGEDVAYEAQNPQELFDTYGKTGFVKGDLDYMWSVEKQVPSWEKANADEVFVSFNLSK